MARAISSRRSRGTFGVAAAKLEGTLGRLVNCRGAACAAPDAGSGARDRALRTAARRHGEGQRPVHATAGEARRPLADPPRPHLAGSQTVNFRKTIWPYGRMAVWAVAALAACTTSGKGVVALEGA